MYTLGIDSTATTASAAVLRDGVCVAAASISAGLTHSETLLPLISQMLDGAKIKAHQLDLIACTVGPGSFTGVRIGVSIAKGLAFGTNIPCAAVSALEALAENAACLGALLPDGIIICPVMDARRSQTYNALFTLKDGVLKRLYEDRIIMLDKLREELAALNAPVVFTGDGYELAMRTIQLDRIFPFPDIYRRQNAACAALIGERQYRNNVNIHTADTLSPLYLRASQAERERLGIE